MTYTYESANEIKLKLINFHTSSQLWSVIIQFQPQQGVTIMELFYALARLVFLCPDHAFGHYVNIQNCFIEAQETRFPHYP
jgi:hypothetical protein